MPTYEQYSAALGGLMDSESEPLISTSPTCGAGRYLCSVSVQGNVNPCGFLGPAFATGNIREQPFETIWRHGQQMQRMRQPAEPGGFRGGCRARALVLAGSADAADPWMTEHEDGNALHPCANIELTGEWNPPRSGGLH
jgi:MoaA/NifB/PqqE/SkfB family radical SAM enzyme